MSDGRPSWLLTVLMVGAMLLSACSSGVEDAAQATLTSVSHTPARVTTPRPVPPTATPIFATPELPSEVRWPEAEEMIVSGEVRHVVQLHSLKVTLLLWNGRKVVTMEPTIDEVFRVIERCGEPCSDIGMATE